MPIFTVDISDRLARAAEFFGAQQDPPKTAEAYIIALVKHTLRGQAEAQAAAELASITAAYDAAPNDIQRQVRAVLGLQGLR